MDFNFEPRKPTTVELITSLIDDSREAYEIATYADHPFHAWCSNHAATASIAALDVIAAEQVIEMMKAEIVYLTAA
jgi:hypothetical protein